MTDTTEATAAAQTNAAKIKTVASDMDARRVFASREDAAAYILMLANTLSDFNTIPAIINGVTPNDEGGLDFDPELYSDDTNVMISTLRRGAEVKAVIVTPIPTLDSVLADETGRAFVQKILDKEFNHLAVRVLREAADVTVVADQMPVTRAQFLTSGRDAGAGIMETFNELFKPIAATISAKVPVWNRARLTKGELKKALQSKGYANEFYPQLENRGENKPSLLVMFLNMGINAAKQKGLDPTIFQRWMDTRDEQTIDVQEEEDFDLDSLNEAMLADTGEAAA